MIAQQARNGFDEIGMRYLNNRRRVGISQMGECVA